VAYKIEKRGNKYAVVVEETGIVVGTYDLEEKAEAALKARQVTEQKAGKEAEKKCQLRTQASTREDCLS